MFRDGEVVGPKLKVKDCHKIAKPRLPKKAPPPLANILLTLQARVKIVRSLKFASKRLSTWPFHSCILQSLRPRSSPRSLANDLQLKASLIWKRRLTLETSTDVRSS